MELRNYAQILLKHWWLIVPLTALSLTMSLIISYRQPPSYQANSTYVSQLEGSMTSINDILYGLDTLTQRTAIFVTYCEVMTSRVVRETAYKLIAVEPTQIDLSQYTVSCNVLPETNVLLLMVQGPTPALASRLNEAVGVAGMARANSLYRYFGLQALDPVTVKPTSTASSRTQLGLLGGLLGLIVSSALAFIFEYLRSPAERMELLAIRDQKLGIYNERYFRQRLGEEINRARIRHRPISVAVMRVIPSEDFSLVPPPIRDRLLRSVALYIHDSIRKTDIIATLGHNTFAVMLPETPAEEARTVLSNLHTALRTHPFVDADYTATFAASSGLVESSGGVLDPNKMLTRATEGLQVAEQSDENTIHLLRTSPLPFDMADEPAPVLPDGAENGSRLEDWEQPNGDAAGSAYASSEATNNGGQPESGNASLHDDLTNMPGASTLFLLPEDRKPDSGKKKRLTRTD